MNNAIFSNSFRAQARQSGLGCSCQNNQAFSLNGFGLIDTPTDDWECFQWVNWHKQLVKSYKDSGYTDAQAQQYAKTIFLTWWDEINTWYGSLNWCLYTSEFYNYFKSVGITEHYSILAKVVAPIISGTANIAEDAGEIITKTGDSASSAVSAAETTTKILKVALPVAVVAIVGGTGYYVYKNYLKGNRKVKVGKTTV